MFCERGKAKVLIIIQQNDKPTQDYMPYQVSLKQLFDDTCITSETDHDSLLELERLFDRIPAQSGLDKTEI